MQFNLGELGKLTQESLGTQAARIKTSQKHINTPCGSVLPSSPILGCTGGCALLGQLGRAPLHTLFPVTPGSLCRPGLRQRPLPSQSGPRFLRRFRQGGGWVRRNEQQREQRERAGSSEGCACEARAPPGVRPEVRGCLTGSSSHCGSHRLRPLATLPAVRRGRAAARSKALAGPPAWDMPSVTAD